MRLRRLLGAFVVATVVWSGLAWAMYFAGGPRWLAVIFYVLFPTVVVLWYHRDRALERIQTRIQGA